ncbi:MAG: Plug domain-containing protein [Mongoliibacter sp.]|uniref:TonB-dependent receptor plug domain-containing protein n=1 Tax=Mongoliibacter sp. TaxID=2022438 RepID=UPI0012F1EB3C|nr:TonB-dependent receptor plug domain-containing protein [Mongoliibacter sp.]TVP53325.1 MAG: Plug domain-containing protein [Mongoliibacter sp.]
MKKSILISLCFFFTLIQFGYGQSPIEQLIDAIESYHKSYPIEKVYLHTDKPHYFLNDTIWFKAYGIMDKEGTDTKPTPSVPLYVELIQPGSEPLISRKVIRLDEGMGDGDIVLPRDLNSGIYTLRAYTEWMRNFGEEVFFQKNIWVGDIADIPKNESESQKFNLQFFPESGYLVAGMESRVAFKATDEYGNGVDVEGYILNSKQDTLLAFHSEHLGMGLFQFKAEHGETYEMRAKVSGQTWENFGFPNVRQEGISFQMDPNYSSDEVEVKIQHNLKIKPSSLNLLGMSKGKVVMHRKIETDQKMMRFTFKKDDFDSGIHTFTLMDEETRLLAERIIYLKPFVDTEASFRMEKDSYKPKDRVRMDIEILDKSGQPVSGDFSVSVTDAYQVSHQENGANILTYLELASEVKGNIEQPYFYFNIENPNAERYLNTLLMTQGWRRFSWDNLSKMESDPRYNLEYGLTIEGRVMQLNEKPVDEPYKLAMLVKHFYGSPIIYEGETDERGNFMFVGMDYQDSVGVFLQAYLEKERRGKKIELKRNEVVLHQKEIPEINVKSGIALPQRDYFKDYEEYLVTVKESRNLYQQMILNREVELGGVTVRGRRSDRVRDMRTTQYNNNPDLYIEVSEEFYMFQNVYQLIRGRLPGVVVQGDVFNLTEPPAIVIRGAQGVRGAQGAEIFIDGAPSNPGLAAVLPITEIERVDIIRNQAKASAFGAFGARGIVNILTISGNPERDSEREEVLGNATLVTQGYSPVREFYIPPTSPGLNAPAAMDVRSTIYWQPHVKTDVRGKVFLDFPLTELSPEVKVTVEGLSNSGKGIHASFGFSVEEP